MKRSKKKTKPEILKIELPKPAKLKKVLRNEKTYDVEHLIKIADNELRDTLKHFRRDGWDLDFRFIMDDVINQVIPLTKLEIYMMSYFLSKGYEIKVQDGKLLVGKKKK